MQATKAGKSLCTKNRHTIDNNALHKHYLELFTWHWRDGRRLTIAAKPAHCAEVKRSLMNRKPYLRELTVTIQQLHCALATNPVGLYIRRNDEKVAPQKRHSGPLDPCKCKQTIIGRETQAVPTFTRSCSLTCTEHQPLSWPRIKAPLGQM